MSTPMAQDLATRLDRALRGSGHPLEPADSADAIHWLPPLGETSPPSAIRPDILTNTGRYFDFTRLEASAQAATPEEIAHALAHTCRYGGHTRVFYSVAEHSVRMARMFPEHPELRWAALFHDAAEAYVLDMPRPIKDLLPDYRALEQRVEAALLPRFGVPLPLDPRIKLADRVLLATEQRDLLPPHDDPWYLCAGILPLPEPIVPWAPARARGLWMQTYADLCELSELSDLWGER